MHGRGIDAARADHAQGQDAMTRIEQEREERLAPRSAYGLADNGSNVTAAAHSSTRPQPCFEQTSGQSKRRAKCRCAHRTDAWLVGHLSHRCGGEGRQPAEGAQQPLRHRLGRLATLSCSEQQCKTLGVRESHLPKLYDPFARAVSIAAVSPRLHTSYVT